MYTLKKIIKFSVENIITKLFNSKLLLISLIIKSLLINTSSLFAHGGLEHGAFDSDNQNHSEIIASLTTKWSFDPSLLFLTLAIIFYTNSIRKQSTAQNKKNSGRSLSFYTGSIVIFVALCSPIDALADYSFFMHMVQHMMLVYIGSLLIIIGFPFPFITKGLPRIVKSKILIPLAKNTKFRPIFQFILAIMINIKFVLIFYIGNIWFWHYPKFYQLALNFENLHYVQHFLFFLSSLLLWNKIFTPFNSLAQTNLGRVFILLIPMLFDSVLGAAVTWQSNVIYSFHELNLWGLSDYYHQQLGGLLMWVGGGMIYLLIMGIIFWESYRAALYNELIINESWKKNQ